MLTLIVKLAEGHTHSTSPQDTENLYILNPMEKIGQEKGEQKYLQKSQNEVLSK